MERSKVREADRSVMPREVALEMLTRTKVQLGGRERKMYKDALETHFTSILQQTPREVKLAFKLQHSTWPQLCKWMRRTKARYTSMQKRYSRFAEKVANFKDETPEKKVGQSKLAAFGIIMGLCGEALDCIETELDRRSALAIAASKISTEDVAV